MRAISCHLPPIEHQYSLAPETRSHSGRRARGRWHVGATLQRRCNGVRGESVAAKPLYSLIIPTLQRLQRCNGAEPRMYACDATRCGHIYARDRRCVVAVLQSSFKRDVSIAWPATVFATPAATAVAAPAIGLSALAGAARSIKYPRIWAGAGRRLRITSIWGVGCACAGSLAAASDDQVVAGSRQAVMTRPSERYQGLSACQLGAFASLPFASLAKALMDQCLSAALRLTDRVKRSALALANLPPRSAPTPYPRNLPRPSSTSRCAAPVGSDPEATPRGGASIGIDRDRRGPGRAGPRGTGLQVAGPRGGAHG